MLISARVHPGEGGSPASHTFKGLLRFLLSGDARAKLLLKNFVFKLVPMLNPDGVAEGHYRMDIFGNNLNCFYLEPCPDRLPSVFAVRQLGGYYQSRGSLSFYIDLHSHPQKKGNFIYGNVLDIPQLQAENSFFAKLLSINCTEFNFTASSFSKYHMNAKDRNEDMTKEGCGRVVFNTHFGLIYTDTLECGYTTGGVHDDIVPIENAHRKFDKLPIIPDETENLKSMYYSMRKGQHYTIKTYENLGKNIAVSLLDLFQLNPASRIPNTPGKTLSGVREEVSNYISKVGAVYRDKLIRSQPVNRLGRLGVKQEEKTRPR